MLVNDLLPVFRSNLFETYLKLMYILFEYYSNFGAFNKTVFRTRIF